MIEVNLLPPQNILSQQEKIFRQKIIYFVSIFVSFVIITQVILFLANTLLNSQISNQNQKKADLLTILKTDNYAAATNLRTLNAKMIGIKEIRRTQTDFGKMAGDMLSVTGQNSVVKAFAMDTTGQVTLTAVSPNLTAFGSFMDNLTATHLTPIPFTKVIISGIKETGSSIYYTLDMKYTFSQKP